MNDLVPRLADTEVVKKRKIRNPDRLTVLPARELIQLAQASITQLEAETDRVRLLQVEADAERERSGEVVRNIYSLPLSTRERLTSLRNFRGALGLLDPEEPFTLDPDDVSFFNLSGRAMFMPSPQQLLSRRLRVNVRKVVR